MLRRLLRRVLRQLRRADRRRSGANVARGSALARDRGLLLLRHLPYLPPRAAVPAAKRCHLLQHSVQQGGTADDAERLVRWRAASSVFPQVHTIEMPGTFLCPLGYRLQPGEKDACPFLGETAESSCREHLPRVDITLGMMISSAIGWNAL